MNIVRRPSAACLALLLSASLIVTGTPAFADQVKDGQWYVDFLKLQQVQTISRGGGVTIALIDSGVDGTHQDLANMTSHGHDLTDGTPGNQEDLSGHGTRMAGLIIGNGRVSGVAQEADVVSVRYTRYDTHENAHLVQAFRWAVEQRVDVICFPGAAAGSSQLRAAIEAAQAADIVVVAAVGNKPKDNAVVHPAAYPGVIAATGVDKDGQLAEFSIAGAAVLLAAPAAQISTTHPGNRYALSNGTSNATAIIAGVVALVRAKYPELSAEEVIHRLTATAIDKGAPGRDPAFGYGIVDPLAALTADIAPPSPSAATTPSESQSAVADAPGWLNGLKPWHITVLVCLLLTAGVVTATVVGIVRHLRKHPPA